MGNRYTENKKRYWKKHDGAYRKHLSVQRRNRAIRNKAYIASYLSEHPCVDCGIADIRVLQFDHNDPKTKRITVSKAVQGKSLKVVQDEIAKCSVRCANCHQIRTNEQRHFENETNSNLDHLYQDNFNQLTLDI